MGEAVRTLEPSSLDPRTSLLHLSSPPNRHDDFKRVTVGKRDLTEAAARDDFAIALQRDTFASEFKFLDEARNIQGCRKRPRLAVDRKSNHVRSSGSCP